MKVLVHKEWVSSGLSTSSSSNCTTMTSLAAVVTFLADMTKNQFYSGAFSVAEDYSVIAGNVDLEGIDNIGEEQELDPEEVGADVEKAEAADALELSELQSETVNCVIAPGNINPFKYSVDKDSLLKYTGKTANEIEFCENKMETMFKDVMNMVVSTKPIDTVFWCPVLKEELSEKMIEVMFLDGTHLKNHFDTILNLVAVTTNNRVIPIAHMLHVNNENTKNTKLFLALVKKDIPFDWDKINIMCDQSSALERGIATVFGKVGMTCSVHLLKNVMKHTSGRVYRLFTTYCQSLESEESLQARDELIGHFHDSAKTGRNLT